MSRPVLHCFTGGRELAQRSIALGLFISFTGILTFKKSDELRAIAQSLPADRIFVETDAPYLAPGRHRGKRNEPAYVLETAKVLAESRGVSLETIARQTNENFFRLFRKVPPQEAAADTPRHSARAVFRPESSPAAKSMLGMCWNEGANARRHLCLACGHAEPDWL
jgi:TatD related DNase